MPTDSETGDASGMNTPSSAAIAGMAAPVGITTASTSHPASRRGHGVHSPATYRDLTLPAPGDQIIAMRGEVIDQEADEAAQVTQTSPGFHRAPVAGTASGSTPRTRLAISSRPRSWLS